MDVANTLAYCDTATMTAVKSFGVKDPGVIFTNHNTSFSLQGPAPGAIISLSVPVTFKT
jgi:hypothetical protein